MASAIKYTPAIYERLLRRLLARQVKAIEKLIDNTVGQIAWQTGRLNPPKNGEFYFRNYPALSRGVDMMLKSLSKKLCDQITVGSADAWELANLNNDSLLNSVLKSIGPGRVPPLALLRWQHATRNLEALKGFQERKIGGLGLSEKVWLYVKGMKPDLELALDIGIGDGKGADALSRSVRRFLRHPDALYRRVRDKETGVLRLSRAAQAFHPGQGVYRSAYKNARRLAATETNMAYRTADHQRRQSLDFVLGIRVNLSNNHTCLDSKGIPRPFHDICDELQGNYPKCFKFVGWHPHCRCYTTTILPPKEEFFKYLAAMDENGISSYHFSNEVTDLPPQFKEWVRDNTDRIERAQERGTLPYFLRDNEGWQDYMSGGEAEVTEVSGEGIPERAERRRASRTPAEIQEIKDRWNARIKTGLAPVWDSNKKYPHELDKIVAFEKYINEAFRTHPEANYAARLARYERSVDKALQSGWGAAIKPMLNLGEQYNTLALADLTAVNPEWRGRYTELIQALNGMSDKCLWDKRHEIGEAFNILKLSELASDGAISVGDVSTRTPYNWFTEFKSVLPDAPLPKKEFFDSLGHFYPLSIDKDYNGAHYQPTFPHVVIGLGGRQGYRYGSPWYTETLFYHEYGHAYFDDAGIANKAEFDRVYEAFRRRSNLKGGVGYKELRKKINDAIASEKYKNDKHYPQNAEMLGSYADTLQAISSTHEWLQPRGHTPSYFNEKENRQTEIFAHMCENLWGGNEWFEEVDAVTYNEFMAFMKALFGIK